VTVKTFTVPARSGSRDIRFGSQRLLRTISNRFDKIMNFQRARVSNGPPKLNNLIKRITWIGFGIRDFENYRIRALLYAGKPNWRVLGSIVVRGAGRPIRNPMNPIEPLKRCPFGHRARDGELMGSNGQDRESPNGVQMHRPSSCADS
jgi:hypothetical protein